MFGGLQLLRVKKELQKIAAANFLKQLFSLPQKQSVQKISTNNMGRNRAKSIIPRDNFKPSTDENQYTFTPQTILN